MNVGGPSMPPSPTQGSSVARPWNVNYFIGRVSKGLIPTFNTDAAATWAQR